MCHLYLCGICLLSHCTRGGLYSHLPDVKTAYHVPHVPWSYMIMLGLVLNSAADKKQTNKHIPIKGWLVWSNSADKPLKLKLPKTFMLVLIERCKNTQSIEVCSIWGCVAQTMGTWASEMDHRAMEEGGLLRWITFSCISRGWLGAWELLTWGTPVTKIH